MRAEVMAIMQARVAAAKNGGGGYGDDLVGMLLEAWSPEAEQRGSGETLTTQEVVDEWKTFFAAAQKTTATLLVWAMFLLAVHPEWQDKVRAEVLHGCGGDGQIPSLDVLSSKLKLVYPYLLYSSTTNYTLCSQGLPVSCNQQTKHFACVKLHMVLLETSRLYPPFVYVQRRAAEDVVIRGIHVPRGTVISIPIAMLHRDKEVWGPDADEFNPMRFQHGATKAAKDPKALLSFSVGPRACIGQTFGVIEAQIVMAALLSNFSFSLSPKYVHKPKFLMSLTPKLGMPLIVKKLNE
jgi:PHYB activation tagged suppressor 1